MRIIVCATRRVTHRDVCFNPSYSAIAFMHDRCTAYDRCSPLVVHIVISDWDEPSLGPNGWSPRLRVCRRFIARVRRLGVRASYRLSQRNVTRPTMEPRAILPLCFSLNLSPAVVPLIADSAARSLRDLLLPENENVVLFRHDRLDPRCG